MGKRENLLAYIEQIKAEEETAKIYGNDWKRRDWKTRQSMKAGELCLTVEELTQTEAKAKRRPGSIGARKAKKKAKAYRRKLKHLEAVLAEKFAGYNITTPGAGYDPSPSRRGIIRKDSGETPHYVE